jgi:protein-L-isoaspartate(D-aspartate) O-methyltransferase
MQTLQDSYKHQGQRKQLINKLRQKGISDERVLSVMEKIPRHYFFDRALEEHAYQDKAFPIGEGQTISQPFTVAYQTQLLEIKKGDKVLEIGTGSGYQTIVLLELGADVYTIENNRVLFNRTSKFLPSIGYKTNFFFGDGTLGLPAFAPFDRIIVTAGAPSIPDNLLIQLKPGGILITRKWSESIKYLKINTIKKSLEISGLYH